MNRKNFDPVTWVPTVYFAMYCFHCGCNCYGVTFCSLEYGFCPNV